MEKLTHATSQWFLRLLSSLILFCMVSFSTNTYAAQDTTLFRIKVLQDSVYAGDTIDVEFYIGSGRRNFNVLNILNKFDIAIATDTSLIKQDKTTFAFDYVSLASFFGTTVSNITTSFTLDPILGTLNIKGSSNKAGKGDARVGQGRYIVQDNAAGRQNMKFKFTKAISERLLGLSNPVKVMIDSVLVLGKPKPKTKTGYPTHELSRLSNNNTNFSDIKKEIRIYPNPASDYINIEGQNITQYKLIAIDGTTISSDFNPSDEFTNIDMSKLNAGMYLLMLKVEENWNGYKIVKL